MADKGVREPGLIGLCKTDGQGAEATHHVRALIMKIVLTPKEDHKNLSMDLYRDLAEILKITLGEQSYGTAVFKNKTARKESYQ